MFTLPTSNHLRRSLLINQHKSMLRKQADALDHERRVLRELRNLGVSWYGLHTMESHYLSHIIHHDERLGGVVYGVHKEGFAMIVATDRRVIFLDKKPMFVNKDEISYYVVSGVSAGYTAVGTIITLHTRIKDYAIRTLNRKCARGFVEYIESRCLENENKKEALNDQFAQMWSL